MSKSKDYDINFSINKLKKAYTELILKSFVDKGRIDCLLGFALTEKGGIIDEKKHLRFIKQVERNGQMVEKEYLDEQTKFISTIYEKYGKNITPNLKWKDEEREYIPDEYKILMKLELSGLLDQANPWEIIAFAEHVPFAPISKLEEKIIETKDPLKILAFAKDVKGANIKKLRAAIERVGNKHQEVRKCEYKGEVSYEKITIDHVGMFNEQFGDDNN